MLSKQLNILIVEDSSLPAKISTIYLESLGCTVINTKTSQEALKACRDYAFDLIFMDLDLPDNDGISTAEMIRTTINTNQKTPIIALTSHDTDLVKFSALRTIAIPNTNEAMLLMNDYIVKPLTKEAALDSLIVRCINPQSLDIT